MGEIIQLIKAKPIPPKTISDTHAGQRYKVTYDPVSKSWVWQVTFTRTYTYNGEADTAEAACVKARRKIHNLVKGIFDFEERNAT